MKKIGLLSLAFIALQNFSVAQTSFDANIGVGAWSAICTPFMVENRLVWTPSCSSTTHLGFGMKTVLDSRLTLSVGVRGHLMTENCSYRTKMEGKYNCDGSYWVNIGGFKYKYDDDDDCDQQEMFINWNEQDGEAEKIVGVKEGSTDYAMVSVPFKLGYQIGKFNPNFGVEYNYRVGIEKNVGELHSIGFTTGLRFDLNDKFAFSTDFYSGITKDMKHKGTLYYGRRDEENPEKIEIRDFSWRSYRIEFSVHYKFGNSTAN